MLVAWPPPGAAGVLLVIAHPDDESMFFAPSVTRAVAAGLPVRLLCLSTGDADGLGAARRRELGAAARALGVGVGVGGAWAAAGGGGGVTVLDDPRLRDGMRETWDHGVVAEAVAAELEAIGRAGGEGGGGGGGGGGAGGVEGGAGARPRRRQQQQQQAEGIGGRDGGERGGWALLTFDARGVSGHANHRDTSAGVLRLAAAAAAAAAEGGGAGSRSSGGGSGGIGGGGVGGGAPAAARVHSAWQLRSEPLPVKFMGPVGALLVAAWAVQLALASRWRWCRGAGSTARRRGGAGKAPPGSASPAGAAALVFASCGPRASLRAMRLHATQWVWYRWLFVAFSSYGWVNVLLLGS